MKILITFLSLVLASMPIRAQTTSSCVPAYSDNLTLSKLFEEDQRLRSAPNLDIEAIVKQDAQNLQQTIQMVRDGQLRTANDYFHAAVVMQHGQTFEDYRLALSLAQVASMMDPDNSSARWLIAAAWDRALRSKNRPQWYGTQYSLDKDGNRLYDPMDETALTIEERKSMGLKDKN